MGWKAACFAVAAPAGEAGAVRARGALSQRSCGAWLFVSVRTPGGSPLPAGRRPLRPLSAPSWDRVARWLSPSVVH